MHKTVIALFVSGLLLAPSAALAEDGAPDSPTTYDLQQELWGVTLLSVGFAAVTTGTILEFSGEPERGHTGAAKFALFGAGGVAILAGGLLLKAARTPDEPEPSVGFGVAPFQDGALVTGVGRF